MSKSNKYVHAVVAHIELAIEYDPNDLAGLTAINAQIRDAARKMVGYRDIRIALGKIPAPPAAVITEPMQPADDAEPLAIPGFLKAR